MSGFDDVNLTDTGSTAKTAAYTISANDFVIHVDATGGSFAVTLPAASAALAGRLYMIVQNTSVAGVVTVKTGGGTINGAAAGTGAPLTASKIGVAFCECDGTNWFMGFAAS